MKARRLTEGPARCKSKRHKETWSLIKESFPGYRVYNEYPYSSVIGSRKSAGGHDILYGNSYATVSNRLRADICIKDVDIVIEVMGEQHYIPVAFGGEEDKAKNQFAQQQRNDYIKRSMASEFGFIILELPYFVDMPNKKEWLDLFSQAIVLKNGAFLITENSDKGFVVSRIDLEGNVITSE